MNKRYSGLIIALLMGMMVVSIGLGFLFGLSNLVSWGLITVIVIMLIVGKQVSATAQFQWHDEYSVGVDALDQDHKRLLIW